MKQLKQYVKKHLLLPLLQRFGCGFLSSVGLEHVDLQLVSILKNRRNGFFIEAGANNGITQSNTYYLEKVLRWRGLLVEPLPHKAEECSKNRGRSIVVNAALVRQNYPNATVEIQSADLMSVVNDGVLDTSTVENHVCRGKQLQGLVDQRKVEVKAISLSKLLHEHSINHVDFFSLDVEGYEAEVLRGIDFRQVTFDYIFIETRRENENEIDKILFAAGLSCKREWRHQNYANKLYKQNRLNNLANSQ